MERPALHDILCGVLGSNHCYFQSPADITMQYPCIRYNYTNDQNDYADNKKFRSYKRYTVTVIDEDPDSEIPDRLKDLPYCSSDRNFSAEGLNHFVFTLFHNGKRIKEESENE